MNVSLPLSLDALVNIGATNGRHRDASNVTTLSPVQVPDLKIVHKQCQIRQTWILGLTEMNMRT